MITSSDLIKLFRQAYKDKWGYIWGTSGEMWTEAKQKALEKTTDSDRAQGRKYGSKWIGHMVADCSGLFSWAFRELGGYMYHGSDTMYRKYCNSKGELKKGERVDGFQLKPGTAVFVWNGTKYSHVGLYVGDGIVIEAMSTINGVTTSKINSGKWTNWGELTGVTFSDEPGPTIPPTIRKGSKNKYVKEAQQILYDIGYSLGVCGVDSDFGSATEKAVKQFQKDHGLNDDGTIGPKTWKELLLYKQDDGGDTGKEKRYSVTITGLGLEAAKALCDKYPNNSSYKEMK